MKRVVKGERRGHAYGLKNRKHGFFGKFGRRGSKETSEEVWGSGIEEEGEDVVII